MMSLIKTQFAFGIAAALAVGCAMPTDQGTAPTAVHTSRSVLEAGDGLQGVEAVNGVTDIEAALEFQGGSTDDALESLPVAPLSNMTIVRTRVQNGPVASTASSTGTGVSHGSPQPLDPKPTDASTKSTGSK